MKVTFVSNYINHHQIPISNVLFRELGKDYTFIQTEPMEEERIKRETQKRIKEEKAKIKAKKEQEKAAEEERKRIELDLAVNEFNKEIENLDEFGNRIVMLQA